MILGREAEQAALLRVLDGARVGRAQTLVVRGEAGIGKTSLIEFARGRADGMTVVSATGVEAEAELEFSGLVELCRPLLRHLDALTEFQAEALRGALGLTAPTGTDRFSVGAATLELLATAAEDRPLLLTVDDAQWVDRASADALRFAARRLHADPVALVFGVRDGDPAGFDSAGFTELRLTGLDEGAAGRLLATAAGRDVAPGLVRQLHQETGGNPLALLELPDRLAPEQLDGELPVTGPLPTATRIRESFARRIGELPEPAQRAVLVVAVSTDDRAEVVTAALGRLDLGLDALAPAEDAGLVVLRDGRLRFRHPLLRAAVYESAGRAGRRAAHRALAESLSGDGALERRAWHLAEAAVGPDEDVAAQLAASAERARARTGFVAAAAAFERAAKLSPDPAKRLGRLSEAAQAAATGGDTVRALRIADEALAEAIDPAARAPLLVLKGGLGLSAEPTAAHELLLEAAALAAETAPETAAQALCEAAFAGMYTATMESAVRDARRARELAPADGSELDALVDYTLGRVLSSGGRPEEGRRHMRRAMPRMLDGADGSAFRLARASVGLALLGDEPTARDAVRRAIELARGRHLEALALTLGVRLHLDMWAGEWRSAELAGTEAVALLRDLGHRNSVAGTLLELARLGALRGRTESYLAYLGQLDQVADVLDSPVHGQLMDYARGQYALTIGELGEAAERLGAVSARVAGWGWYDRDVVPEPDLVEIHVRLGSEDEARRYYELWRDERYRCHPEWAAPITARCAGLLAGDDGFAEHFEAALGLHSAVGDPFALARTRLCFGERLRRLGRKREARDQLREAYETFARLEAGPWADRARRELRSTGEKIRRARASGEELTPQERQIALQVAEGKSNKQVAAALFLSPKTIEFHLSRVYRKLELASRAELVRLAASGALLA